MTAHVATAHAADISVTRAVKKADKGAARAARKAEQAAKQAANHATKATKHIDKAAKHTVKHVGAPAPGTKPGHPTTHHRPSPATKHHGTAHTPVPTSGTGAVQGITAPVATTHRTAPGSARPAHRSSRQSDSYHSSTTPKPVAEPRDDTPVDPVGSIKRGLSTVGNGITAITGLSLFSGPLGWLFTGLLLLAIVMIAFALTIGRRRPVRVDAA